MVVITTRLPPAVCGVGAYSWELQQHWPGGAQPVEFLAMEKAVDGAEAQVTAFNGNARELRRALDRIGEADAVLHYTGRGYHPFGCPIWMPGVLTAWKHKFRAARLLIFFHEMPGGNPGITSPHFWLGKINGAIVRRLARIADVLVTNTAEHVSALRNISHGADVHLVPVASNIAVAPTAGETRDRTTFVIFGMPFGRLQTLQMFESHIAAWRAAGQLSTLHLVGPEGDAFSAAADRLINRWAGDLEVVRHGALPSVEVSRLLQRAQFALTNVTEQTWSKSGTFMACATHRCAVVVRERSDDVPLSHAISAEEIELISDDEVATRTAALADWAEQNASWDVIAGRVASLLRTGAVANAR